MSDAARWTRPVALLALGVAFAGNADASPQKNALRELLEGVRPEVGVQRGSLIVLPLLRDGAAPHEELLRSPGEKARWELVSTTQSHELVQFTAGGSDSWTLTALAGRLLPGPDAERMLTRAVEWRVGDGPATSVIRTDGLRDGAVLDPGTVPQLGPLAPLTQRKLALLGEGRSSFRTLQQLQAYLTGMEDKARTVGELLESPFAQAAIDARWAELGRIPGAYAGKTVGHVAFFGYRAVEFVVLPNAESYQKQAPEMLRSLAVSHAIWEEVVGLGGRPLPAADLREMKLPATRVLQAILATRLRRWRTSRGEAKDWPAYTGVSGANADSGGYPTRFVTRITLDGKGRPLLLEAIENGAVPAYPAPLKGPSGREEDARPNIKGGAFTEAYMRRLLERRARQRR